MLLASREVRRQVLGVRLGVDTREYQRVQLEVGDLAEPEQRRQVVARAGTRVALVVVRVQRTVSTNGGSMPLPVLLVEVPAVDAVRVADQRQRAVAQVRQQVRRDSRVVDEQVALGQRRVALAGHTPCRGWSTRHFVRPRPRA